MSDVMTDVMTVRGPIPAASLGMTLPHEHLFLDFFRITGNRDGLFNDVGLMIEEAARFKVAGGSTIVEVTSFGLGRDPVGLKRVAEGTGLAIVMGTGWYREPYYDHAYVARRGTNELAQDLIAEIEQGDPATGIRPGIIGEVGAHFGWISPAEERVLRAAARAQCRTGLTITLHAIESPVGLKQLDILEEEGVDLRRVIVGHADTWPDADYHAEIVRRGALVEIDTINGLRPYEVEKQVRLIVDVARRGHIRQLLISHDNCLRPHLVGYGGHGFTFIPSTFATRLRQAGLADEQLRMLLVENPRRALTGEP